MDAIKGKMVKLSGETATATAKADKYIVIIMLTIIIIIINLIIIIIIIMLIMTISSIHIILATIVRYEEIGDTYKKDAEKIEVALANVTKKFTAMESSYDVALEDLFNATIKLEEKEKVIISRTLNSLIVTSSPRSS